MFVIYLFYISVYTIKLWFYTQQSHENDDATPTVEQSKYKSISGKEKKKKINQLRIQFSSNNVKQCV